MYGGGGGMPVPGGGGGGKTPVPGGGGGKTPVPGMAWLLVLVVGYGGSGPGGVLYTGGGAAVPSRDVAVLKNSEVEDDEG